MKEDSIRSGYSSTRRKLLKTAGLASLIMGGGIEAFAAASDDRLPEKKHWWDPYEYGAKADGVTIDTMAIQKAIDLCAASGGGKVLLYGGTFVSGTIILKSHVTLQVESGATLRASKDLKDFPDITPQLVYLYARRFTRYLIYAERCESISIMGRGTIDGNGREFPHVENDDKGRPYILRFSECRNVMVRDVTLLDSARWFQHYLACDNVMIDGITVIGRTRENRDGIDIDSCERVRIVNCNIDVGDDAIVLKATAMKTCRNVVVSNCVLRSRAAALKIGTESCGGFESILFTTCIVYDTPGDAIALEMVDGGRFDGVTVSNIIIKDARNALFIRLGARGNRIHGEEAPGKGSMRNIIIENIQASGIGNWGCSITGLPDQVIHNLKLSNIRLQFKGGGTLEDAQRVIPEKPRSYPNSNMYGMLPVYGLFIRHVENVSIHNIELDWEKQDFRPALYAEHVTDFTVSDVHARVDDLAKSFFVFNGVSDATLKGCRASGSPTVFLQNIGEDSDNISLFGNDLSRIETIVSPQTMKDKIHIGENIR